MMVAIFFSFIWLFNHGASVRATLNDKGSLSLATNESLQGGCLDFVFTILPSLDAVSEKQMEELKQALLEEFIDAHRNLDIAESLVESVLGDFYQFEQKQGASLFSQHKRIPQWARLAIYVYTKDQIFTGDMMHPYADAFYEKYNQNSRADKIVSKFPCLFDQALALPGLKHPPRGVPVYRGRGSQQDHKKGDLISFRGETISTTEDIDVAIDYSRRRNKLGTLYVMLSSNAVCVAPWSPSEKNVKLENGKVKSLPEKEFILPRGSEFIVKDGPGFTGNDARLPELVGEGLKVYLLQQTA